MSTPQPQTEPQSAEQAAVTAAPAPAALPPALQPISGCFALSRKALVAAFPDPKEGETRFAQDMNFAAQALMNNSYLITCASNYPDDLINAIKNVALTGTTLNPTLKLSYLVPFKGRISLMPSYMGLVDILISSGLVTKVEAHPVFKGDEFEIVHGTGGYIKHRPDPWGDRSKENLLGCYFFIKLADGGELFDTLSKAEIEAVKERSPSVRKGQQSPWDTDYIEMAKKTAIRRGFKICPKSGLSDSKLKVVEAAFAYDEAVEKEWVKTQPAHQDDGFNEEEVEYIDDTIK